MLLRLVKKVRTLLAQIFFCVLSAILTINRKYLPTQNLKNILLMEAHCVPRDVQNGFQHVT